VPTVPVAPIDIQTQKFRIVFRGYDVEAVDAFLDRVQQDLARLTDGESDEPADPRIGTARPRSPEEPGADDPAGAEAGSAARALRTLLRAEALADQMLAEAGAEADQNRARAQREAEQIVADARAEGARFEAEELFRRQHEIHALALRRDELQGEVDRLSGLQHRARESLQAWLAAHHELLERAAVTAEEHEESAELIGGSGIAA
jgi:DivIVA domain-containing protein